MKSRKFWRYAVCLFVVAVVLVGVAVFQQSAVAAKGDKAPDFSLKDINGKECKLSDYKGKVVVINFFATW